MSKAMRLFHIRLMQGAIILCCLLTLGSPARAQFDDSPFGGFGGGFGPGSGDPVVSVAAQFTAVTAGRPTRLFVTATMKSGWHIYSITQGKGGPVPSKITLAPSAAYRLLGAFSVSPLPKSKPEPAFNNLIVESHYDTVTWYAPIELSSGLDPRQVTIEGSLLTQPCDANACLPPQSFGFTARLGPGIEIAEELSPTGESDGGQPAVEPLSREVFTTMLIGAFLGGLVLNLMPCVLPVISLKLLAFVEQGGQSRAQVFALNLWYAAGLMLVFIVLATLSASFSLAWGEQFTLTWFKVSMTALVFVMALSFLGVWEIPIPGFVGSGTAGQLQTQEGAAGAFFKGVFTTILATPCTGPFLGPVFGFTLEQPAYVSYLLFGTVGLGMASPYLVIGAFPEVMRFLPRPGAWMETVKQVMGFLLLATVVYLFTTMSEKYFISTLALLVSLWFACWLVGRMPLTASPNRKTVTWVGGTATAALVGVFAFTVLLADLKLSWQEFSPGALKQARAEGKTVMVDFTADWCPNCKWNLKVAIDTEKVLQLVEKNGVVPMIADWTDRSPMIEEVLRQDLKRQSIPVLAIYAAGAPDHEVIILDGTLVESQVLAALEKAGPSFDITAGAATAMASP